MSPTHAVCVHPTLFNLFLSYLFLLIYTSPSSFSSIFCVCHLISLLPDELLICDLPEINALDEHSEEENLRTGNMWILKPSLTNQGKGISVVASLDGLRECLTAEGATDMSEWVAQRYIPNPLLMGGGRKFHIRCYVLAVGTHIVDYLID